MQFPESWLREFCNPPIDTQTLADTLTMAGLEVEELKTVAPEFKLVVVAEIKVVDKHPDAERLRVCQVDVGQERLLTIVCGAPNARIGIKVPCALVGAELPPGADGQILKIKISKLRGVESQGMLCSARELGISDVQDGLLELNLDSSVGQDIRICLNLDDTLFTLKLTPNLAHCLSVYGVAREVSALTGAPLNTPKIPSISKTLNETLKVNIRAPDLCGRFSGRIVRNVDSKAITPTWMVDRLARCGQRSVTALVDISNYVMFELGRPSHIFDLDKIHGDLDVRWAKSAERLKLLNGNTVSLDESVGVIADAQQVESLAGIMGGEATAVNDDTENVYVEAAFWWPEAIAGRSRKFNFSTEAGHRFERGVDPGQTVDHIDRITELILDVCGTDLTVCGPIDDQVVNLPKRLPVQLRIARACKIIGMQLTQTQCLEALKRLGLDVEENPGVLTVIPPSYRFDLQIEEDLIEEVARIVGFNQLPHTPPLAPTAAKKITESKRGAFVLRRIVASLGYQETINFSFVQERWEMELAGNSNPIKLLNPIASHMSVMRSSLIGSLLQVVKFNLDRKADRVRIFEIGRVFMRDLKTKNTDLTVEGFQQPMRLAGMAYGQSDQLQWGLPERMIDFFDIKGDVQKMLAPRQANFVSANHPAMHPGRCASVAVDGLVIGFIGELHPRWRQSYGLVQAPLIFELDLDTLLARDVPAFKSVSKFQPVERDIAVWVDEKVDCDDLMSAIYTAPLKGLLRDAKLFDIYRPKELDQLNVKNNKEKSMAIRLTLNSDELTLTDAQIDDVVKSIVSNLIQKVGARQRT